MSRHLELADLAGMDRDQALELAFRRGLEAGIDAALEVAGGRAVRRLVAARLPALLAHGPAPTVATDDDFGELPE